MLFNSGVFLKFFAAFLLLYFLARHHLPWRNRLIVAASYLFYGWWDYRFLLLLVASSWIDFAVGLALERTTDLPRRRRLLGISLLGNLGVLGFFKYFNFFVDSARTLAVTLGIPWDLRGLDIVLPVGISFYTFQTLSYTIDVYRRAIPAERNLMPFLAYVSFFPQLVAGPIERAAHLLPQFRRSLQISADDLREGTWLFLWGLFKKVVLADNFAPLADMAFSSTEPGGPLVVLGTIAFGLQIYCDFSGYSDMARGLAALLGFKLMINFNLPYSAESLREFWRRWHISLSTWLRDYLYVTLGGNRRGSARTNRNLFLTMLLGGLWHGAAWNFVLWGMWHGLGLIVERAWDKARTRSTNQGVRAIRWLAVMAFVFYGWLLFRAGSWEQIVLMTSNLAYFRLPAWFAHYALNLLLFASPLILMQIWQKRSNDLLVALRLPGALLAVLEGLLALGILVYWNKQGTPFIYFQF